MLSFLPWLTYLAILFAVGAGLLGAALTFVFYLIAFGVLVLVGIAFYKTSHFDD